MCVFKKKDYMHQQKPVLKTLLNKSKEKKEHKCAPF